MASIPRTYEIVRTIGTHESAIRGVKTTPDGHKIVSASDDGIVKVWDFETGKLLHVMDHGAPLHYDEGTGIIFSLEVMPDGRHALTGGNDNSIAVWDIESGLMVRRIKTKGRYVNSIHTLSDGKEVLVSYVSGSVEILAVDTGAVIRDVGDYNDVSCLALVPGTTLAVVVSNSIKDKGVWHLVDYQRSEILYTRYNFSEEDPTRREDIKAACVSPDGQFLITSTIGYLKVWTLNQGELLDRLKVYRWFHAMVIPPGNHQLVVDYCRELAHNLTKEDQNRLLLSNRFEIIMAPPHQNLDIQRKTGGMTALSLTGRTSFVLAGTGGYNGRINLINLP